MNYVYVVTSDYAHEGEAVVGVYSTLELARINRPDGGDSQHLYRFQMNTRQYEEMGWAPPRIYES